MKTFINNCTKVLIVIVLWEVLSYGCINMINKFTGIDFYPKNLLTEYQIDATKRIIDDNNNYHKFDSLLGWTIKSNANNNEKSSNQYGARWSKTYSQYHANNITRVESYGDSYTFCDDVNDNETWQTYIEGLDSLYEAVNWGVGAYGLDQAYLRYTKTRNIYESEIILIGYMTENIARNVNTYRPFYVHNSGSPLTKPRFIFQNDSLVLLPNYMKFPAQYDSLLVNTDLLLHTLGEHDYYYNKRYNSNKVLDNFSIIKLYKILFHQIKLRLYPDVIIKNGRYNTSSEAYRVTIRLYDKFYNDVKVAGQRPIIVIFPNFKDFRRHIKNEKKQYQPLIDYFKSNNYEYIDLMEALDGYNEKDLFRGHYSPIANKLVADMIYNYIKNSRASNNSY